MRGVLLRIWSGLVGAVAGAAVGVAIAIVLMTLQMPLEKALWAVAGSSGFGLLLGLALAKR